eukprot:gnl/TRDRNA2_/TRDRNA2_170055_c0_seq2.p1 gnl/TRDRNA2_/TRDRNA2_170055_c0~~gnl/TRDRNA2_/TRDRNA2_170055_c0_seq2.p1  ORF type:complete len:111 (-),score=2.58 gnl/TRDRNA2_/TRDRNA2_170055_c0_seq2:171-503(-)
MTSVLKWTWASPEIFTYKKRHSFTNIRGFTIFVLSSRRSPPARKIHPWACEAWLVETIVRTQWRPPLSSHPHFTTRLLLGLDKANPPLYIVHTFQRCRAARILVGLAEGP